ALPILLGNRANVEAMLQAQNITLPNVRIIDPKLPLNEVEKERQKTYGQAFYAKRQRKGIAKKEAQDIMRNRSYYGSMMVEMGDADAMIGGLTNKYPSTVRPALEIIGAKPDVRKVASMHIVKTKSGPLFFADTTINHHLDAEDIASIAELVAEQVRGFNIEPRIALVTYSNFGSVPNGESAKLMRAATKILHERHPDWIVDGEMQAHLAFDKKDLSQRYPFSKLSGHQANTIIFPNLSSANIAYNLLSTAGETEVVGPILLGLNKPVHILQLGSTVRQIIDMVGIAAIHAQEAN
ncbi:MAG: phosphate acyltransferase, partial [Chitinophagales bacterium]